MILVDSSVLIDLIEDHPRWRVWSEDALVRASSADDLAINVLIYAEISRSFASGEAECLFAQHRYRGRSDSRRCRLCSRPRAPGLSRCRRRADRDAARFLYRRACGRGRLPIAYSGCETRAHLFPIPQTDHPAPELNDSPFVLPLAKIACRDAVLSARAWASASETSTRPAK